jgi:hypothetical protein
MPVYVLFGTERPSALPMLERVRPVEAPISCGRERRAVEIGQDEDTAFGGDESGPDAVIHQTRTAAG